MKRRFNRNERFVLFHLSGGKCTLCGRPLGRKWHADHIRPYSKGGVTVIKNGQALCPKCNQRKSDNIMQPWSKPLRRWQLQASAQILNQISESLNQPQTDRPTAFTLVAFPGSGKTTLSLRVVHDWLSRNPRHFVIVVVPSKHLKMQFHQDADRVGIRISHDFKSNKNPERGAHGIVVTYQQLDNDVDAFKALCLKHKTLVVMDECHHLAGENAEGETKAWGDAAQIAFSHAHAVLMMSGTLWRNDDHNIPFVHYNDNLMAEADYEYGYDDALQDTETARLKGDEGSKVAREVVFPTLGGDVEFWHKQERHNVILNELLENRYISPALRTALHPDVGDWFMKAFREADHKLQQLRTDEKHPFPDAAGLVIASSRWHAEQYADLIQLETGERPFLVHYKEDNPRELIDLFKYQQDKHGKPEKTPRWIVSVKMISEGTDIPRLAVLFYATIVREKLYFYQAIGRVIRWHKSAVAPAQQLAYVYMPFIRPLTDYAQEIKEIVMHYMEQRQKVHRDISEPTRDADPFVPLDSEYAHGDLIFDEERIPSSYRTQAEELLRGQFPGAIEAAAIALKRQEERIRPPHMNLAAHDSERRRETWKDEINKQKEVVEGLINQIKYRCGYENEDPGVFRAGIYAYIKGQGYRSKNEWGDRTSEIISLLEGWLKKQETPKGLHDCVRYYRTQKKG